MTPPRGKTEKCVEHQADWTMGPRWRVATAGNAIKCGYPITAKQIADLCRQFDNENGMWYTNRPLEKEADRAVEYAYRNS